MMNNPPDVSLDDFTAAKEIFEKLHDLPSDRQQRVLRWVAEGLGLMPVVGTQAPTTLAPIAHPGGAPLGMAPTPEPLRHGPGPHLDIKSFVLQKSPTSDMQFAAVVAYWYRFEAPPAERKETITSDVLIEAARLSGRKRPPKPRMTLTNAKNQGYLDSVSRGEYSINSVGENLVAMTLGGDGAPAPRRGKKKANAKKPSRSKKPGSTKSKSR
ncbi:MAG: hypothetical protein KF817_08720 [Phycisphaeraceae bacterium]|nr:hypothetical protein [Phycisphaeraceae bacterium]